MAKMKSRPTANGTESPPAEPARSLDEKLARAFLAKTDFSETPDRRRIFVLAALFRKHKADTKALLDGPVSTEEKQIRLRKTVAKGRQWLEGEVLNRGVDDADFLKLFAEALDLVDSMNAGQRKDLAGAEVAFEVLRLCEQFEDHGIDTADDEIDQSKDKKVTRVVLTWAELKDKLAEKFPTVTVENLYRIGRQYGIGTDNDSEIRLKKKKAEIIHCHTPAS